MEYVALPLLYSGKEVNLPKKLKQQQMDEDEMQMQYDDSGHEGAWI